MASGFGLVTHFVNKEENNIPENAVTLSTIHDYLVMKLTGRKTPLMHSSDAASLGCFDLKKADFDGNGVVDLLDLNGVGNEVYEIWSGRY